MAVDADGAASSVGKVVSDGGEDVSLLTCEGWASVLETRSDCMPMLFWKRLVRDRLQLEDNITYVWLGMLMK